MKRKKVRKVIDKLIALDDRPAYQIAIEAGIHETILSKLRKGAALVRPGDPRIRRLAEVLNVPESEMLVDAAPYGPGLQCNQEIERSEILRMAGIKNSFLT